MKKIDFATIEKVFTLDLNKIEMYSKLLDDTLNGVYGEYDTWSIAQIRGSLKMWVNELKTDTNGYVSMLEEYLADIDKLYNDIKG